MTGIGKVRTECERDWSQAGHHGLGAWKLLCRATVRKHKVVADSPAEALIETGTDGMRTAADRSVCRGGQSATYQLAKRESKPPCEQLHDWRRPDGKRRRDARPSPSPSPQPRPATSLQLRLNKPKIEKRVQELSRSGRSARSHLAKLGKSSASPTASWSR